MSGDVTMQRLERPAVPGWARDLDPDSEVEQPELPALLLVSEAAAILRVSTKAFYAMVARGNVPGVVRYGTSIRVRSRDLLDSADQKHTPSSRRTRR